MSATGDTTSSDTSDAPVDQHDRRLRVGLAALTVLAGALFVAGVGGPLRAATMIPFVLLCPGVAWSRHLSRDPAEVLGFGVAIGMALAATVAQAMALVSWWSPGTGFAALAALTALGAALPRRREGDPVQEA